MFKENVFVTNVLKFNSVLDQRGCTGKTVQCCEIFCYRQFTKKGVKNEVYSDTTNVFFVNYIVYYMLLGFKELLGIIQFSTLSEERAIVTREENKIFCSADPHT